VNGLWERVVLSALPTGVSTSVQEIVGALGEKPRDATLAASYVASATGGVAGGAAAKSALGASAKLSASAKSAVALSSQSSAGAALSLKLTALLSPLVSAKTLALASVTAYVYRLVFTGETDAATIDSEWADVAGEAGLAAACLAAAAVGVTFIEELAAGELSPATNSQHHAPPVLLPPREQLVSTLLGADDARLKRILTALAHDPPSRDAALACRDAFKDAALRATFKVPGAALDEAAFFDRAKRRAANARRSARQLPPDYVSRHYQPASLSRPAPDSHVPHLDHDDPTHLR